MRGCVVATAALLLACALLARSLPVLLVLLGLAGLANAVCQPAINLFMADQVPLERQGIAFGIKQSAIPTAVLVSGLALPLLALPLGWRATFAICAGAALVVAAVVGRSATRFVPPPERERAPRPSRKLIVTAVAAAIASGGPSALGAYLVASAVDVGIAEGAAGVLAAAGSAASLLVRIAAGASGRPPARLRLPAMVALLVAGAAGFALLTVGRAGAVRASARWSRSGWAGAGPGLFNLAVVDLHREAPAAATGVTQTGIYVGAAAGPAAFGLLSSELATRPPGGWRERSACWRRPPSRGARTPGRWQPEARAPGESVTDGVIPRYPIVRMPRSEAGFRRCGFPPDPLGLATSPATGAHLAYPGPVGS